MTPERTLWQTVVYQAVRDATFYDGKPKPTGFSTENARAWYEADRWIRSNSADFQEVCENAGIDPKLVRDAYINGKIDAKLLRGSAVGPMLVK